MLRYKGEVLEMYGEKVKQVNKIAAKNAYERAKMFTIVHLRM